MNDTPEDNLVSSEGVQPISPVPPAQPPANPALTPPIAPRPVAPAPAPMAENPKPTSAPALPQTPSTTPITPPEKTPVEPPQDTTQSLSLHALTYSKAEIPTPPSTPPIPDEEELAQEPVFAPSTSEPRWRILAKAIGVFLITFIIIFAGLEGPALTSRVSYYFQHLGGNNEPVTNLAFLPRLQDRAVSITEIKDRPQEYLDPSAQLAGYGLSDLGDDQLLVPKISVKVPIVWGSDSDEGTMLTNLQKGVVHYGFTALPNDGRGNVFLSGHSSYLLWDPGQYKTVFANLDRLETGDQLALTYQGIVYIYEVTGKQVVKPDNLSVLDQTDEPTLSLMTCVPVGTSLNRLVVTSKLVTAASNRPIPLAPQELTDPAALFHYLPF